MNVVPILFTFDDNLVLPASVCMSSLLQNALPDTFYDIFVLHSSACDFSSTDIARIPEYYPNCRVNFRKVDSEFVGSYEVRGITETCYYRMLSPELIPEYDKILYSDVDVIFREDLSKYYEIDIGDNCFGAVDNCSVLRPAVRQYVSGSLGLDPARGYFYSGNLVINLKTLREEGLCDSFRELGRNKYRQQDMDIINIACNGRFYRLPLSFCLTVNLYHLILDDREGMLRYFKEEEVDYALSHGIVHYNGAKPWNGWCHHFDLWWETYRKSPFFDEKFYASFYRSKDDEYDRLSLMKRVKILVRFFVFGRKK